MSHLEDRDGDLIHLMANYRGGSWTDRMGVCRFGRYVRIRDRWSRGNQSRDRQ